MTWDIRSLVEASPLSSLKGGLESTTEKHFIHSSKIRCCDTNLNQARQVKKCCSSTVCRISTLLRRNLVETAASLRRNFDESTTKLRRRYFRNPPKYVQFFRIPSPK